MNSSRAIPPTRSGTAYRTILVAGGLLAVVGIADAARALFWLTLDAAAGLQVPAVDLVKPGLRLLAWGLIALAAYTGWRRNVIPATWMLVTLPVLAWALLLMQKFA